MVVASHIYSSLLSLLVPDVFNQYRKAMPLLSKDEYQRVYGRLLVMYESTVAVKTTLVCVALYHCDT